MTDLLLIDVAPQFREGGVAESQDVPDPWDVAIGGHPYKVEWSQYQFQTVEPFRTARDFDASPGEHSLNTESTWKRNRDDWRLGSGQVYSDGSLNSQNVISSLDTRFNTSKGIDWTTDRQLTLLHDTEQILSTSETNLRTLYVGGYLYVLDGATLHFTEAEHAPLPLTWTDVTLAANGVDLTTDGNLIYVALTGGHGIWTLPVGSSSLTHMGNAAASDLCSVLVYANGWLMAGISNVLTSIDATGAHQGAYTHPVTGGRWSAVVGAPNAIYAAFNANDVSLIYQIGVNAGTGALNVPLLATPMPNGETVLGLGYYATRILVGTNHGVRVAEIAGDGSLALGPLLETGQACRCFASYEALTFFGWSNFDNTSSGLGAMRLSDLVNANQPAWSSWLLSTYADVIQGQVTSMCVADGDPFFCVAAEGVWRPAAKYVPQGTLDQGRFTFGVHEAKQWAAVEVVTAPLQGAVGVQLVNDDGLTTELGLLNNVGATNVGQQLSAVGLYGEQASLLYTLYRDTATGLLAPVIHRVTFRALPNPLATTKHVVPLILKDHDLTQQGEGGDLIVEVAKEVRYLRDLRNTLRPVAFQKGTQVTTVQVRSIDYPNQQEGRLTGQHDEAQGIWYVTLIEVFTAN